MDQFWVAGERGMSDHAVEIRHPFDSSLVATVAQANDADIERAVSAADAVAEEFAGLPAHIRAAALDHVSVRLRERTEEIAQLITAENGKPIKWARIELARASSTFRWAAEEARRFSGELQRLDTDAGGTGRMAMIRRFPRGPVLGIAPFNFPVNLVAHKVAPALAVGAPIIVKPAPATPLAALALGEILAETDLPSGSWSVLPIPNEAAGRLVSDPRLPVVSFTGSGPVGWSIMDSVPRKHVTLELGGNAATVVCRDWTDMEYAAGRIATFSMYQAGQSCISVQRVYIDSAVYDEMSTRIVDAVRALKTGDPKDEATDVGPMINHAAAERVERWVVESGAKILTGGERSGATYAPTVLVDAPSDANVVCDEVFGPVVVLAPVENVDEAFAKVNESRFGLQAGVFTQDLPTAFRAHRELKVGGVIIGDVPSFRADQMPYGGVKESGIGREGVASAMEDFTEPRVLVLPSL